MLASGGQDLGVKGVELGAALKNVIALCAGCCDGMEITFAGTQRQTDTEREFFRFLVRQGIPVRIESNR